MQRQLQLIKRLKKSSQKYSNSPTRTSALAGSTTSRQHATLLARVVLPEEQKALQATPHGATTQT